MRHIQTHLGEQQKFQTIIQSKEYEIQNLKTSE